MSLKGNKRVFHKRINQRCSVDGKNFGTKSG